MPYFSRWKTIIVWLVVLLSIVVALPNAVAEATLERLPDWVPKKQLMLGLDLQGGSQITLKVEREDVVKTRLSRARTALRRALLERAGATASDVFRFPRPRCDRVVALVLSRIANVDPS